MVLQVLGQIEILVAHLPILELYNRAPTRSNTVLVSVGRTHKLTSMVIELGQFIKELNDGRIRVLEALDSGEVWPS